MYVEDQIIAMRQQRFETPFGWLICFEGRPLQGIPPKGHGPYVLFFSAENKAQAFISDRKRFFGEEPLSAVSVDSPDTLKSLTLAPSVDSRYAAPPCGIVLDFDYTITKSRKILAPAQVGSLLPAEIARVFGLSSIQAARAEIEPIQAALQIEPISQDTLPAIGAEPRSAPSEHFMVQDSNTRIEPTAQDTLPAIGDLPLRAPSEHFVPQAGESSSRMEPISQAGKKKPLVPVLITCGSLLVIGLCLLGIGGAWFAMRRGLVPALSFLSTPTQTQIPTEAALPTATLAPTATAVPIATEVVWQIKVEDDFSSNVNGWPVGFDKGQYGSSNLAIQNGKLVWEVTSVNDSWYWWYPDLPILSDFDVSMDIQRTEGSTTGDYGMVVRLDGDQNSFYYFAINDANQEYAFLFYQNDNWRTIQGWTYNSSIGSGKINRIEVKAIGSRFVFSINGTEAGKTDDTRLASGQVGILAKLYDDADSIKVEYDNLVLHGNR